MRDFLSQLGSLSWWLSVVIVGILINMFSAVLSKKIDARLSKISSWWRSRSEKRQAKREEQLENLQSVQQQILFSLDIFHRRFDALFVFVGGALVMFFVKARITPAVIAAASLKMALLYTGLVLLAALFTTLCLLVGTVNLFFSIGQSALLREARKQSNSFFS